MCHIFAMAALTLPVYACLVQACGTPVPIRPCRAAAYHRSARHARTARRSQAALSVLCGASSSEEAASLAGMCSILLVLACNGLHGRLGSMLLQVQAGWLRRVMLSVCTTVFSMATRSDA